MRKSGRWTPLQKERVVARHLRGEDMSPFLLANDISAGEFDVWVDNFQAHGRKGLKVTGMRPAMVDR